MIPELLIIGAIILMAQAKRPIAIIALLIAGLTNGAISTLPVGIMVGSLVLAYAAIELLKRRLLLEQPVAILLLELTGIAVFFAVKTAFLLIILRGALVVTLLTRGVMSALLYMMTLLVFSAAFMATYYLYYALVSKITKTRLR